VVTRFVGIALCTIAVLTGCAADYTSMMSPVRSDLSRGSPEDALRELEESFSDSTGNDRLLYLMELGNLCRLAGYHERAQAALILADRISDLQRGVDLGEEIGALLTSDLAREFRGADFEKVFINYCLAASFAAEGDLEEALVEARRVNEKLKVLNQEYEHRNRYDDDAFVRYFMGVLYEAAGDLDDALVSYRLSAAVYDSVYLREYGVPAPDGLRADILRLCVDLGFDSLFDEYRVRWPDVDWESTLVPGGTGEVVVVLEVGNISARREHMAVFSSEDRVHSLALPSIPPFPRRRVHAEVRSGGVSVEASLVEDLDGIARKNLEDQAARDVAAAIARLAVKAGIAEAGESIVREATDDDDLAEGVGFLLSLVGAASERADLRAWLTLPSQIHMARLALPAGWQDVDVYVDGRLAGSERVDVPEGGIGLLFFREGF
jgi:hypothetical protein